MTINITKEIEAAYAAYLAAQVDAFVDGTPITRGMTAPYSENRFQGLVDFAAGFQAALPPQEGAAEPKIRVEARECDECGHLGINDADDASAACSRCGWSGPEPTEDKCPGCGEEGTMCAACPECGGRYALKAEADIAALSPQGVEHPSTPPAMQKLAAFGSAMLHAHRGTQACEVGDIDGGTCQDLALKFGVLEARQVKEACGESCVCAEVTDFPAECYFVPADISVVRAALAAAPTPSEGQR